MSQLLTKLIGLQSSITTILPENSTTYVPFTVLTPQLCIINNVQL